MESAMIKIIGRASECSVANTDCKPELGCYQMYFNNEEMQFSVVDFLCGMHIFEFMVNEDIEN